MARRSKRLALNMALAALGLLWAASLSFAAEFGPLKGRVVAGGDKAVVVFLHGDVSRGGFAVYHYRFLPKIVSKSPQATAIGLLRPGYSDRDGQNSPGTNHNRRDQYTQANNDLVAETLRSIRAGWPEAKLIVIGHSGGAAQLGVVIAQHPGLVDTAILLACPCHLENWMSSHPNWNPNWTRSLSPSDFVGQLTDSTKIIAITGSDDDNTRPFLAEDYVYAANQRGIPAEIQIVKGGDHNGNFQLERAFLKTIQAEVAN